MDFLFVYIGWVIVGIVINENPDPMGILAFAMGATLIMLPFIK